MLLENIRYSEELTTRFKTYLLIFNDHIGGALPSVIPAIKKSLVKQRVLGAFEKKIS